MQIRNTITLIGHLGQDAKVVTTKNGEPFLSLRLATKEYSRDKEGNRVSRTEWHNILVFGKERVDSIRESFKKGTFLAVNGVLRYKQWVDQNEQKRTDATIHLTDFAFLSRKEEKEVSATS